MAELMKRIQCDPRFPAVVNAASYTFLTLVSATCLTYYFTQMVENDFKHWQLLGYVLMLANGLTGYIEFFDEDSFCPLRDLLDYCAIVLILPCYAAETWIKTEMGPPELSAVLAGLGFIAAMMYVVLEYRRQDLTDLAVYANAIILLIVGSLSQNPLTCIATSLFTTGYSRFKRTEDVCCLGPQEKFNIVLAFFALTTLGSLDDDIIAAIRDAASEALNAIGMGGEAESAA